jgi:hypothetical protein
MPRTKTLTSCRPATTTMTVLDLMTDRHLLGPYFVGESWDRHRAVLKAAFALPLTATELELFTEVAEREPPRSPVRELVYVAGRGSGKDSVASLLAAFIAATGDFSRLRPGEYADVVCLASDKEQAGIAWNYIAGYFRDVALLASMVERIYDGTNTIELNNRARIIVTTNNFRAPRGRTFCCAILDELGFWRSEDTANPDFEVDAAVAPGLMRWPGSLKILISSAYRRTGLLYERFKQFYGKDDDDVLVVKGTSLQFNPTLDQAIIDRELAKDFARASSEYLCIWRDDLSTFVDRQLVEELIDRGIREHAYDPTIHTYSAFVDEAGGSGGDASTLAIVHRENDLVVADAIRIFKPPFSPEAVIREKAQLLRTFRINKVIGDRWAGGLPPELYHPHGIRFEQSSKTKSDLYLDFLHILNSRRIRLLDEPVSIAELCALERKTAWGGKESIDHPVGANYHDDAINALAGAAVFAAVKKQPMIIHPDVLQRSAMIRNRPSLDYGYDRHGGGHDAFGELRGMQLRALARGR